MTPVLFSVYAPAGQPWHGAADTLVLCAECGAEFPAVVRNDAINAFSCPRCDNECQQFIYAARHTIRTNYAITAAAIHSTKFKLPDSTQLQIRNNLDVINSRDEPVVQICRVSEPHNPPLFEHRTPLITPTNNLGHWELICVMPVAFFPVVETPIEFDVTVSNTWGDQLARHHIQISTIDVFRRMIQVDFAIVAAEQPTLANEFRRLETQTDSPPRNGHYTQLVLRLAEYLLDR